MLYMPKNIAGNAANHTMTIIRWISIASLTWIGLAVLLVAEKIKFSIASYIGNHLALDPPGIKLGLILLFSARSQTFI